MEREILGSEGLEGRGRNKVVGEGVLSPLSSHSMKSELGSGGPAITTRHLPSPQAAQGRTSTAEGTGGGESSLRSGKGLLDWIWLGEREGSQVRQCWGAAKPDSRPPAPPRYVHPSVRVGMMLVWAQHLPRGALWGDGLEAQGTGGRKEPSQPSPLPKPGRSKRHI